MKLFLRHRNAIQLTAAGRTLYEGSLDILQRVNALLERTRSTESGILGSLKIGFVESMEKLVSSSMASFRLAHPGIEVNVDRMSVGELNQALQSRSVDVGISYSNGLERIPDLRQRGAVVRAQHCRDGQESPFGVTRVA